MTNESIPQQKYILWDFYFNCKTKSIMQMNNISEWMYEVLESLALHINGNYAVEIVWYEVFQPNDKYLILWAFNLYAHFLYSDISCHLDVW